jgi:hypothetical protein
MRIIFVMSLVFLFFKSQAAIHPIEKVSLESYGSVSLLEAEILLESPCMGIGQSSLVYDTRQKTITLIQHVFPASCYEENYPIITEFNIGVLPAGTFSIVDGATNKNLGLLRVEENGNLQMID